MKNFKYFLSLVFLCAYCTSPKENPTAHQPSADENLMTEAAVVSTDFNNPVLIDHSDHVMYLLNLIQEEESRGLISSKDGYDKSHAPAYWNIVFYNTATGASHLLDDKRKMLITTYAVGWNGDDDQESVPEKETNKLANTFIFYKIAALDFNQDGHLDENDPQYLFVSDKDGYNFRQISPDSLDVSEWMFIKGTNKVLIQTSQDSNNNSVFDSKDRAVPVVWDMSKSDPGKATFSPDFINSVHRRFKEHWQQEE